MKSLFFVFASVLVAELGDKTQVATLLFATDPGRSRTGVFIASSLALVLSSLIAVLLGNQISRFVSPIALKTLAGMGFVAIGIWILATARS
jgi:putative Ca2+/H+ antiporter (TMEM165/GDT1 family)